jgi:putative ABC transport system permease protein
MATVAGVTALAIGSNSDSAQAQRDYVPSAPMGTAVITGPELGAGQWADVEAVLHEQAPDRPVHRLRTVPWVNGLMRDMPLLRPGCSGGIDECRWALDRDVTITGVHGEVLVIDAAAARGLSLGDVGDDAARVLSSGRVAVVGDGAVDANGTVRFAAVEYEETGQGVTGAITGMAALPATAVPVPSGDHLQLPGVVLVPPELADRLPLEVRTTSLVTGGPGDPVTPAQEQEMREVLGILSGVAGVTVERGWQDRLAIGRYVLFGLGALLVLIATLTATGLALTDARPDFATLAAVGAAPRTRRFMAMGSAAVVGGGGALLGVLVGMAPGIAVAYPLTSNDWQSGGEPLIDVPWLLLGGVAVLVPLLAVAVTGLAVRSRLPLSRS